MLYVVSVVVKFGATSYSSAENTLPVVETKRKAS